MTTYEEHRIFADARYGLIDVLNIVHMELRSKGLGIILSYRKGLYVQDHANRPARPANPACQPGIPGRGGIKPGR